MAFNAKNLQYNKQEPAFLRKLKGEYSGLDGRHDVQIARPKKDRLRTADDDDDPLIVDEQGEAVDKAEYERRLKGEVEGGVPAGEEETEGGNGEAADAKSAKQGERQKVTVNRTSGNAKKRKVGKVVGGADDGRDKLQEGVVNGEDDVPSMLGKSPLPRKDSHAPKKKGKKIKLSFQDPEG